MTARDGDRRRWRPGLGFVLAGGLAGTLALSLAGLVALRYLGPVIGFRQAALALGALILMATAVLGWLLHRLLLRPVRALEAYAQAVAEGAPAAPPQHFGTRETARTARRVIAMAESLRDREATIRAYTDHVTHELKTPVTAILAASEMLEDSPRSDPEDARLLADLTGAARQIEAQLAALRDAARARETRYLGTSTLVEALPGLAAAWPGLAVVAEGRDQPLPISAQGLGIVLGHLARNAAEQGARQLQLAADAGPSGPWLTVRDDGPGVPRAQAARIFEPFFTTRRDQGGTGMGLAILRNLLAAHGAQIELLPADTGPGAAFRIAFAA